MGFRGLIESVGSFSDRCAGCGRTAVLPLPPQTYQCRRCHHAAEWMANRVIGCMQLRRDTAGCGSLQVECVHHRAESANLGEVLLGELTQQRLASRRDVQTAEPPVLRVGSALDEACADRPVDELAHAVVAKHEVISDVCDRRGALTVSLDSQ